MRRQDELIALYPGQDRLARKFLLSQMEGLALAFDAHELLDFLRAESCAEDPVVRGQARHSLSRFIPSFVNRRYAVLDEAVGVWSSYKKDEEPARPITPAAAPDPVRARQLKRAALESAGPLIRALRSTLDRASGWDRVRAILALAPLSRAVGPAWITHELERDIVELPVGNALSELDDPLMWSMLVDQVRRRYPSVPDHLLLLRGCPGRAAFDLLVEAIPRSGVVGRMNVALALSAFPGHDVLAVAQALCEREEGWVSVAALGSLEALADPAFRPYLTSVARTAPHKFLRMQALRALAAVPGDPSVDVCMEVLERGSEALQGVALECLARLGVSPERLDRAARPLISSSDLKARVHAILALQAPEEAVQAPGFRELLMSSHTAMRLEAAHCLGYLQSASALATLATLARADPAVAVRTQAVKSLSKYPAADAVPVLLDLTIGEDARVSLAASTVTMRFAGEEAAHACELVAKAVAGRSSPFALALMYRTLGCLAGKTSFPRARRLLETALVHTSVTVVLGAVEGWNLLGTCLGSEAPPELERLAREGDLRVRPRAALACWQFGVDGMLESLATQLETHDGEVAEPPLDAALELGLLLPGAGESLRFAVLAGRFVLPARDLSEALAEPSLSGPKPVVPGMEDAPFPVRRPARPGRRGPSPNVSAAQTQPSASGPAPPMPEGDPLAKFLSELPVAVSLGRDNALAREIARVSNLVSQALPRPPLLRRVWQDLRVPVVPALLLVLIAVAVPFVRARAPAWTRVPGALVLAAGKGRTQVAGQPLARGAAIPAGALVETAEGGDAIVVTPGGNRIALGPASAFRFEGAFVAGRGGAVIYRFAGTRGVAGFEFRGAERLALDVGPGLVLGEHTIVTLRADGRRRLQVDGGEVVLRTGSADRRLGAGTQLVVD